MIRENSSDAENNLSDLTPHVFIDMLLGMQKKIC